MSKLEQAGASSTTSPGRACTAAAWAAASRDGTGSTGTPRDGDGGEQVLEVVAPDEAGPGELVSLLASGGEPERDAAVHAEGPVRAGGHTERDDLRCEAAREVPRRRVVAVQDREVVRLL